MERKKGVLLSYVLMLVETASALLLTPIIIRAIGQAEYGVYKLTMSISTYLMLFDMGVGNSIVRYIAKYRATGEFGQERKFFGVAQVYYIIAALIAGGCGLIITMQFPKWFSVGLNSAEIALGQKLLVIISLNIVVTLATSVFHYIVIGYGKFTMSKGASVVQTIIRVALTFAVVKLGYGSVAVVIVNLLMTVLFRAGFGIYVLFKIKLLPMLKGVDIAFIKDVVGYSSMILLQMVATQINAMADQILLGILVPGASLLIAVYGVGAQLSQYFQSIGSSFGSVLMPGIVDLVECGASAHELQNEMIRIGRLTLLVLMAVFGGFVVFGKQFISLWTGDSYIQGYFVAVILMAVHMLILAESIGTQILWAKNEHKEQAILKFVIVLLNIALTVVLIKWQPVLGAVIGTAISLLFGDIVVMNFIFKKKIGINLKKYYFDLLKGILPATLVAVAVASSFSWIGLQGWIGFAVNITVYCVVYCILSVCLAMNKYEKKLIFGLFKKFQHDTQGG